MIVFFISLNLLVKSFYFRNLTTHDQKIFIKKFLLPWKGKEDRANKNFYLEKLNNEINFKKSLKKIKFKEKLLIELENNLKLEKYTYLSGFETGIDNNFPGSGYIDFYENNFIVLSSRGILGFGQLENSKFSLKQIENDIDKFIGRSQFEKHKRFSIKDLKIHNNKIYIVN